jgi:hypothetical protein
MKTDNNISLTASKSEHTPEPWELDTCGWPLIINANNSDIAVATIALPKGSEGDDKLGLEAVANGLRIIRCVNGCKGVINPERAVPELLAALHGFIKAYSTFAACGDREHLREAAEEALADADYKARAAIADNLTETRNDD